MQKFRKEVEKLLQNSTGKKDIILEVPPNPEMGDFAFPCFDLAKEQKKKPTDIAQELAKKIPLTEDVERVEIKGPYLNFFISRKKLIEQTLKDVDKCKMMYGSRAMGKKTIVIDYSSPNIAKPFGIGHLRSTVIGNSLKNIFKFVGYNVVGVNHLGDWGTQFGKLIVAFNKWGSQEKLKKNAIGHLFDIYVEFHKQAELHPELEDQARECFKKLEEGDEAYLDIWNLFRELSLQEFKKYYKELGIDFDFYTGESFYNKMLDDTIIKVQKKIKTEMSEGALVVNLEKDNMPPMLLKKSDEASTYHTRDMAAVLYRLERFKPEKILYVVGAEQILHFNQLFKVLEMMGEKPDKFVHVPFGLMRFKEGKMSTRAGNIIFLEEVLDKAIELAKKTINEKNPQLKNKEEVAHVVGIGAVIFADLSNDRVRDITFEWEKILDFEGETAPYLQYTYARISSILRKALEISIKIDYSLLKEKEEFLLAKKMADFPAVVEQAASQYKPHIIARYLLDLAQMFNSYYQNHRVIQDDEKLMKARLLLIGCVRQIIQAGLSLLGIKVVQEM